MVRLDVEGEDPHVVSGLGGEHGHTDAIAATYLLLALDEVLEQVALAPFWPAGMHATQGHARELQRVLDRDSSKLRG